MSDEAEPQVVDLETYKAIKLADELLGTGADGNFGDFPEDSEYEGRFVDFNNPEFTDSAKQTANAWSVRAFGVPLAEIAVKRTLKSPDDLYVEVLVEVEAPDGLTRRLARWRDKSPEGAKEPWYTIDPDFLLDDMLETGQFEEIDPEL